MKIIRPVSVSQDGGFSRASIGTYWDKKGLLQTALAHTLRVTYDPSNLTAPPYTLYEKGASNYCKASDRFELGVWSKIGVSVEVNTGTAPNGSVAADKLVEGVANTSHYVYQARTAMNEQITASVYVKAAERSWFYLNISNLANESCGAHFNLLTKQVVTIDEANADYSNPSAKLEDCGNGWFRCIFTVTKGSVNSNNYLQMNVGKTLGPTTASLTYAGDGVSGLYVWGAQLEAGPKATSYFPTSPDFVSRASIGTYFDITGTLQTAALNVVRKSYDPKNVFAFPDIMVEDTATNMVRNNTMTGGTVGQIGSGGAMPSNWSVTNNAGLTNYLVAKGVENGIEYIDVRVAGNATGAGFAGIYFDTTTGIPAALAQVWATSVFCKQASGTLSNVSSVALCLDESSSASAYLAGDSTRLDVSASSLSAGRGQHIRSLSNSLTAYLSPHIKVFITEAGAVDITLRIGLPQAERHLVTSPIKTTSAAASRSNDVVSFPQFREADLIGSHGLQFSTIPEDSLPAWSSVVAYAKGDRVLDAPNRKIYEAVAGTRAVATFLVGVPGKITLTIGGQPYVPAAGSTFKLSTTGVLPSGVAAATLYYVRDITGDSFTFAPTPSGTLANATGTQSGVHSLTVQDNVGKPITNKAFWIDAGASNKYRAFDTFVQSQAMAKTDITFVVSSATFVDTVSLLNVKASNASVSVTHITDGLVFSKNIPLVTDRVVVDDWSDYFLTGFNTKRESIVEGMPRYGNVLITVCLGGYEGQDVALGAAIFGLSQDISVTRTGAEHGAKVGIQAFDVKKRDDFGNYTVVPRAFAKRADFTVYISNEELDSVMDLLTDIRSVPTLYLGSNKYNSTMVYGYYKSFDIDISYPQYSVCSIQLEGLT